MIKQVSLAVCLLSFFSNSVYALDPKPMSDNEKRQADIRAYFKKTPDELHQDLLKQQLQDQEWHEEQIKQAKRKKAAANGQDLKSEGQTTGNTQVTPSPTGIPSVSTPSTATPAGTPAPKVPEDYTRGY
jgi:heme oxygenase